MTYHIVNPAAGHGEGGKTLENYRRDGDTVYYTTGIGDAQRYIEEVCRKEMDAGGASPYFMVYGGDGTLNEAVNGVMKAGAGNFAVLTAVPTGSGNDFVRSMAEEASGSEHIVDVIRVNDGYAVNVMNIGFDCTVVVKTQLYKKRFSGSFAYILGVANTLFHKLGRQMHITWEDEDGVTHTVDEDCLLCVVANQPYYGGGFRAAPCATAKDGLLDVMIVKTVSRLRFIKLVRHYYNGTHIQPDGTPAKQFADVVRYIRCKKASVSGMDEICRDGEITSEKAVDCAIVPGALRYRVL